MFWHFILDSIPWPLQLLALVLVIGLPVLLIAGSAWGWPAVLDFLKRWGAPILGVLAAIGLLSRSRQQGYADRKVEEKEALDRANQVVEKERTEVNRLPDADVDKEIDRWSRK
jgi:hypothetical protein